MIRPKASPHRVSLGLSHEQIAIPQVAPLVRRVRPGHPLGDHEPGHRHPLHEGIANRASVPVRFVALEANPPPVTGQHLAKPCLGDCSEGLARPAAAVPGLGRVDGCQSHTQHSPLGDQGIEGVAVLDGDDSGVVNRGRGGRRGRPCAGQCKRSEPKPGGLALADSRTTLHEPAPPEIARGVQRESSPPTAAQSCSCPARARTSAQSARFGTRPGHSPRG